MKIGNLKVYGIVYKITNEINNKVYIGITTQDGGFDERYENNISKYTRNLHLKNSILKYGLNNFNICKIFDVAFSKEELNIKEICWINYYNSTKTKYGYNIREGGSNGKLAEETKRKLSLKHMGKGGLKGKLNPMFGKKGSLHPFYNKHHTNKTKKKMSIAKEGIFNGENNPFYNKHHTEKTKKLISKANKNKRTGKNNPVAKSVYQFDSNFNIINKFDTIKEASDFTKIRCTDIIQAASLKINQITSGGFYWIYKDNYDNDFNNIKNKLINASKYRGVSSIYILIKSNFLSYKICIGINEVTKFLNIKKDNYRFCTYVNKYIKYKDYYYIKIKYNKDLIAKAEDFMGNLMMSRITDETMLENLITNWYSNIG